MKSRQGKIFPWAAMLVFTASALLVFVHPARGDETNAKRPNILFVYTDDHSYRTIGCYPESYDWVRTPNIDALAKSGMRFTHAYIGTWCMPSRAAMLTGHHPYGVQSMTMSGKYPSSTYDPQQAPFWPSVFRKHGYHTAQIGKWHTGTDTGFGRDWDYQVVWNRPRHVANAGNYYDEQLIETNGGEAVLTRGYTTDKYTDLAVEYLRGEHRDSKKPWYLWLCYGAVHGPFTPAARHQHAYPNVQVKTPTDIYPPRAGKPQYMQEIEFWIPGKDGQPVMKGGTFPGETVEGHRGLHGNTLQDWVRQYHQGVLAIDEGVGRLVETLRETNQLENTLIVFTSDQGFGWGEHGFCSKLAPYDATIRSPLIVSMPGRIPAGSVCPTPVGGVDLPPTFFRFAGLELPWSMHGHDLTPLLENPHASRREPVLLTLTRRAYGAETAEIPKTFAEQQLGGVPWWIFLVRGHKKYIRNLLPGEIEELYDLDADPEELTNLALDPAHQQELASFRQALLDELARTDSPMLANLPPLATKK